MQREQMKDAESFDRVVKALTGAVSRRHASGLLVGLLATVVPAATPVAWGKKDKKGKKGKKGKTQTLTCASAECTAACTVACYNATIEPCLKAALDRQQAALAACTTEACRDAALDQGLRESCACDQQFPCCSEEHICTGL